MKKSFILFFLLLPLLAFAAQPATHSVDVEVALQKDGSAIVTETWHISVFKGTEWYTVMDNLGNREMELLGVSENGVEYINEGEWDIDRSISEKANRCGVVKKRNNSYEICWGIGVYGEHTFVMKYRLTNLVQGYNDFDGFNHMFISRGIKPSPQTASVTIVAPDTLQFSTENTKIAGFGYTGQCNFYEGKIVAITDEPMSEQSGIILMIQCNKGLFEPTDTIDGLFVDVVDQAMEGSTYAEEQEAEQSWWHKLLTHLFLICAFGIPFVSFFVAVFSFKKILLRKETGKKMDEIPWSRNLPYGDNIYATFSLLTKLEMAGDNGVVSALILRMVQNQALIPMPTTGKDKMEFAFNEDKLTKDPQEKELFEMLRVASGSDHILQEKEFKRWSIRHAKRVYKWFEDTKALGENDLNSYVLKRAGNTHSKSEFKLMKQQAACEAIGLKKFLEDTTLIDERRTIEVVLWKEYLIYASLFGIADKVTEELKQFQPEVVRMLEEQTCNNMDVVTVLNWSRVVSNNINKSVMRQAQSIGQSGNWGGGGSASFGGGGGFSGGGFGGGSR